MHRERICRKVAPSAKVASRTVCTTLTRYSTTQGGYRKSKTSINHKWNTASSIVADVVRVISPYSKMVRLEYVQAGQGRWSSNHNTLFFCAGFFDTVAIRVALSKAWQNNSKNTKYSPLCCLSWFQWLLARSQLPIIQSLRHLIVKKLLSSVHWTSKYLKQTSC